MIFEDTVTINELRNSEEIYKRKFVPRYTVRIKFSQCDWGNAEILFMNRLHNFMDKIILAPWDD